MSFTGSNGGRNRAPSQVPVDPSDGLVGRNRAGAPWRDLLGQLAVRAARLPVRTGLIGGQYAQHVAQNLAPMLAGLAQETRLGAPPTTGDAPVLAATPPQPSRLVPPPSQQPPPPRRPTAASKADIEAKQRADLRSILIGAEGRREDVYPDSLRVPTVGIGHKVRPSDGLRLGDKIGGEQIENYFQQDTAGALDAARAQAAQAGITDPDFIAPLASVNFQLGPRWNDKHKKTWELIMKGDYAGAADEAGRSKWYKQTPNRVKAFQGALRRLAPTPSDPD